MIRLALTLSIALVLAACGGPTSIKARGSVAGPDGSGTVEFTFPSSAKALSGLSSNIDVPPENQLTALLLLIGSTQVTLTGSFDPTSGSFNVTGGGYTLTGTLAAGLASGTFTGPKGSGSFSAQASTTNAVKVFCGTFSGGGDQGTFNLVINGSTPSGTYFSTVKNAGGPITGTMSGTSLTLQTGSALGTISGDTVSGTFAANGGGTGTWSGSVAACTGG